MTRDRHDLTADWPAEPGNEELAAFAADFMTSLPELPPDALARVRQAIGRELRTGTARRGRPFYLRAGLAAGFLLAVGICSALFSVSTPRTPATGSGRAVRPPEPARVEDVCTVDQSAPRALPPPDRALLPLDDYRSLFANQ